MTENTREKFGKIKQEFKNFDRELQENFRFVVRDTAKGIWGASDLDSVFKLFQKIQLNSFKNFLDIGCGDGRVVIVASLFTTATGIEIDKELINKGNEIKNKLKANNIKLNNAALICDDYFSHDFSKYDFLFINPDTGFYNGLEDKLIKEMKQTAKLYVYNNIFLPRILKRGKDFLFNQTPIIEFTKNEEQYKQVNTAKT